MVDYSDAHTKINGEFLQIPNTYANQFVKSAMTVFIIEVVDFNPTRFYEYK